MTNLIELKNVTKSFESAAGRYEALKNINLSIGKGEFLAVVGRSGSGKSTLLNMLTGIDHPTSGSVIINDTEIHNLSENDLALWRGFNIGIVFQFFQLIPTLSITENLLLAMDFVNVIPVKERKERAFKLLDLVGIFGQGKKLPASLSGGEQQRAAIARALANDPPILVADEPTGNLDSKTSQAIQQVLVELVGRNKTVIVVTHEKTIRLKYNRIITLNDGMVINTAQNAEIEYSNH